MQHKDRNRQNTVRSSDVFGLQIAFSNNLKRFLQILDWEIGIPRSESINRYRKILNVRVQSRNNSSSATER